MPQAVAVSATIIQFAKAAPRRLRFSTSERQALLSLTYALPGTGVDFGVDEHGDEYASLGAHDFQDRAWWTVLVTSRGFDMVSLSGYRVADFTSMCSLVDRMKPHLAYMLRLATGGNAKDAGSHRVAGACPLTVV